MFRSTGLAKMFAGRRKFFRGPHVRHLCSRYIYDFAEVKQFFLLSMYVPLNPRIR